jgi:hypothetical protein
MNPITSPIARATKMFGIIDETPGREGWFPALLTKDVGLHESDRTLQTTVTRPSYRCPPRISESSSLDRCRSKTAAASRSRRCARLHDGGVKTPRDERAGGRCGPHPPYLTLLCQSTHNLLVPVEPVSSWCPISRSQYNWEEEVSHQLKGELRNAVCLDGIGHDDDSPNAASSDAARASCPCEIR